MGEGYASVPILHTLHPQLAHILESNINQMININILHGQY